MQEASSRTPRVRGRAATLLTIGLGIALALGAGALSLGGGSLAQARTPRAARGLRITSRPWGTYQGKPVRLYSLSSGHMQVNITNFGGIVQAIYVPDRHGRMTDISLGFRNLAGYIANDQTTQPTGGSGTTYFGATIGRYANRIAGGKFTLDGVTYKLPVNNGPNTLHGGTDAWNKQVWSAATSSTPTGISLTLSYTSPNMQDGFPGTVPATVMFTLTRSNALRIQYHATTDKPTVINMTNHSYFNLAGQASGSILTQRLMIDADRYTPTDATQIPTGKIVPVAGTAMDFRRMKAIGRDITSPFHQLVLAHGYDHNWVLNRHGSGLQLAARAIDPVSGRELTAYTTEPGVQLYTSNFLVGELVGTTGRTYRQSAGFTLETQHFPNSPNQPNFPSTTLLPGHPFDSTTVFQFSVAKG
jgi:aldose 1-epimerase